MLQSIPSGSKRKTMGSVTHSSSKGAKLDVFHNSGMAKAPPSCISSMTLHRPFQQILLPFEHVEDHVLIKPKSRLITPHDLSKLGAIE